METKTYKVEMQSNEKKMKNNDGKQTKNLMDLKDKIFINDQLTKKKLEIQNKIKEILNIASIND